ncbi:MAG: trypsin-like serine protease [Actinobacteria bacterium]|nr:trypsin-like serine protease [Actinomycetota bacterium]
MQEESPQSPDKDINYAASGQNQLVGFGRHRLSLSDVSSSELIQVADIFAHAAVKQYGGDHKIYVANALRSVTLSRRSVNVSDNSLSLRSSVWQLPSARTSIIGDVNSPNFLNNCIAIVLKTSVGNTFVGSGVLIAPNRVLTASHVGVGHPPTAFAVSTAPDVNSPDVTLTAVLDATFVTGSTDLAVLLLQDDLNIEPAILADAFTSITNPLMIAGYGLSNNQQTGIRHSGTAVPLPSDGNFVFIRKLISNGGVSTSNPAPGDSGSPAYNLPLSSPPIVIGIHQTMPGGVPGFGGFYELVAPIRDVILNL